MNWLSSGGVLGCVTKTLTAIWPTLNGGNERLGAMDRGILEVALMVAALDGTILPDEYAAFEQLSRKCRGGTEKNVRRCLDHALRSAGYLMAMAQVGVYTADERIATFVETASDALPAGFDEGNEVDVRRAFALWVAIGVADGEFSDIERAAVDALVRHFSSVRQLKSASVMATSLQYSAFSEAANASAFSASCAVPLLEDGFIDRAVSIVRDLSDEGRRETAEVAFRDLIGTAS